MFANENSTYFMTILLRVFCWKKCILTPFSWDIFVIFLLYKVHKWKKCSKLKNKTTFTIPTFLVWYIKVILFYWFFTSESILWTFFIFIYLKCEKHRKIMKNMLKTKKQDHFYSLNFKSWYYKSDLIFLFWSFFGHILANFLLFHLKHKELNYEKSQKTR